MALANRNILRTPSALRSGALTGLAQIVLALAAAGAGALLAHKFGRSAETDGFLAAYGVYLVLVLAAQAFRMVVVPDLTPRCGGGQARRREPRVRARLSHPRRSGVCARRRLLGAARRPDHGQPAAELGARRRPRARRPRSGGVRPAARRRLAASALAAIDSYGTAAAGFALGGIAGLVVFAALADGHGIVALAWGLAVNAAVAFAVPVAVLVRKRALTGPAPQRADVMPRLWHLLEGASVPLALQGCYLLALRFAAQLGVGSLTSFSYAYLAASTLVGATAFSLGLISSAPLTRRGVDPEEAGRHVVHAGWVSLSLVGAAAGVFALVGGRIVGFVLGDAYKGEVGRQLGHLVVYLSPWMVAWVGFAVTFPLVFVAGRRKALVPLAVLGFGLCIPLGLGLRAAWGLPGIAIAIGLATLVIALGLMAAVSMRALMIAAVGLARLALAVAAASALAFGGLSLALSPIPAALLGVVVYALVIFSIRSFGLSEAWAYVRGLH